MDIESMIERFIDLGIKAYKKKYRKKLLGRKLDRHETIKLDGVKISCWKELAVYKMAQYIMEIIPGIDISYSLEGNNSNIEICIDDDEEEKIKSELDKILSLIEE